MKRTLFSPDHEIFRQTVREFLLREVVPHQERWAEAGIVDRQVWREAGAAGLLCPWLPEADGGPGGDFLHSVIVMEELGRVYESGFALPLHSDIVVPYLASFGSAEFKRRVLPGCVSGDIVTAIAMTEPGTGSDLQAIRTSARRDGDHYVLSGQKTFITNGGNANLIIVACRTGGDGSKGMSLLVVETEQSPGFRRGRLLDKIGLKSQDTSELFFDDVRVPADNLLGGAEGQGFIQLMQQLPQERLIVALGGIGAMERALAETLAYTKERQAFGKPIWSFQNTRFKLAEVQATVLAARAMVDAAMLAHLKGELGVDRAALLKYWVTEQQGKVMDECLQLFGGYGYMSEYPIAELYTDARVQRIYGGTNEIMKELASRFM